MLRAIRTVVVSIAMVLSASVGLSMATTTAANADSCYTWDRTLREGSSGSDVTQLQIRVAGWAGYKVNFQIDGQFGPATKQAVRRFQSSYGLQVDGVAGPQTFSKIYALQDSDCSPAHFAWSEVDGGCGQGGYSGGNVSASTVKSNLLKAMWRAESLRKRLGNHPLRVTSGFRSVWCDRQVGGSGNGNHTRGMALDLVGTSGVSYCQIAQQARYTAYNGILGPGFPGHYDHVHVDIRSSRFWDAYPDCGVSS